MDVICFFPRCQLNRMCPTNGQCISIKRNKMNVVFFFICQQNAGLNWNNEYPSSQQQKNANYDYFFQHVVHHIMKESFIQKYLVLQNMFPLLDAISSVNFLMNFRWKYNCDHYVHLAN